MTRDELIKKMWQTNNAEAALDVVLGEVLGEPTRAEAFKAYDDFHEGDGPSSHSDMEAAICYLITHRRAHYSKVKTAEERVTVRNSNDRDFDVWMDGKFKYGFLDKSNAEIYRLGLIAQLKAGQQ